jgi:GDP-L-fucose synthase
MRKDSRIYVAGHRGLVGSAIVRRLQLEGYGNLLLRTHAELDLTDQRAVLDFFRKQRPEQVFLAAARVGGIMANDTRPAEFIRDNLLIQTNIIDGAQRAGSSKLLFLGSSCIYPKHAPQPMREEHLLTGELEPTNQWYAVAKIAGIKMCQAYRRQYGFNAISLMPTNLYGPGDNFDLAGSHVLPAMLRKFHLARLAQEGETGAMARDESVFGPIPDDVREGLALSPPQVVLWGTGTPLREFLHVDDLADACLFLMQHYEGEEIVNVGVGQDISIRDLSALVAEVVGFSGEVVFDASKPDGTPRKLLDVRRLRSLGWNSSIPLDQGIRGLYDWYTARLR